jgi:hypothetical protein
LNSYEQRQEVRRQRYLDQAAKNTAISEASFDRAHRMGEAIPFGQPILVGHHSEGRDRRYRGRIVRVMDQGMEASKKADYYEDKAASVGKGGISSDDPDAIAKLRAELDKCEKNQEMMRAANKIIKSKKLTDDQKVAQVAELMNVSQASAAKLLQSDFAGRIGFADYQLTNNSANIRRIKERIASLEASAGRQDVTEQHGDITYRETDNRVELIFPGKPSEEIRSLLKYHGFKWSPARGAWVRMLNGSGRYAAKYVLSQI